MLLWVLRRRDAFAFLVNDMDFASGSSSKEMTQTELQMLVSIVSSDQADGHKFWGTALVVQVLANWGAGVSTWLHGCACSHHETDRQRKSCSLKGRRAVELASGAWKRFIAELKVLSLPQSALAALAQLRDGGQGEWADFLLQSFQDCKSMMEMRCYQCWSFWGEFPFSILQMCGHFVDPNATEDSSRTKAQQLKQTFDSYEQKTELGIPAWFFFGNLTNRQKMIAWIQGRDLSVDLQELLVGYSTALVVMQRLESRHHLVNISMSRGRAQTPASVIAGLRRRMNQDLTHPTFRHLVLTIASSGGGMGTGKTVPFDISCWFTFRR